MTVLVKNGHFQAAKNDDAMLVEISNDTGGDQLKSLASNTQGIIVAFPSSADGRGFSIALALRQLGYKGQLRARGHLIADQYPLALRCGFDEVEISDELAARQIEPLWLDAYSRIEHTYQRRLMGATLH